MTAEITRGTLINLVAIIQLNVYAALVLHGLVLAGSRHILARRAQGLRPIYLFLTIGSKHLYLGIFGSLGRRKSYKALATLAIFLLRIV